MLDEKGRLFGKINIVDLIIIVVIAAAVIFVGLKVFGPKSEIANTNDVTLTLFCEEAPDYVAEQLEAGTSVYDSTDSVALGTLTDWSLGDSKSYVTDANGNVVEFSREEYCSVTLSIASSGLVDEHGVTINGTLFAAGHSMTVYAGECKLYLKVMAIG